MGHSILPFVLGVALGLAVEPAVKLADRFRWKVLLGNRALNLLPCLWIPLGGPVRQMRWRLGRYRRAWLKCEVCGAWVNTACQPCRYGAEHRDGKYPKVGCCGKCKEKWRVTPKQEV